MKNRFSLLLAVTCCLIPMVAAAGPCEDLARLAMKTGGKWKVAELPPRSVAQDGPFYATGDVEDDERRPSGFVPHHQADRARLLKEMEKVDPAAKGLAVAWLSPSAAAFEAAMVPVVGDIDSQSVAVRVHRWPGTSVFAVSAHDTRWYDCQRDMALFYTGTDKRLHFASANGMGDCKGRGDPGELAAVSVNGRFGFMDEMPDDSAVSGEVGLWQEIMLWQGDRLGARCPLAYTYDIGYVLSDQSHPEDANGRRRPANTLDGYLAQAFPKWMLHYAEAQRNHRVQSQKLSYDEGKKLAYGQQIDLLRSFAAGDDGVFANLKSTYDGLLTGRAAWFDTVLPVRRGTSVYLVTFKQQYMGAATYPYIDLVLYSADGKPPQRLANITVERKVQKLVSVKVAKRL